MFDGCKKLTSLNLSSFDTSNVTNMFCMFENCSSLTELDLSSFDFTNVTTYSDMFKNVPTDCLIYVKNEAAKSWIEDKFTELSNIQIKS
jgi:surface protein